MANNLPIENQISIVAMLAEGNSIRGIERVTGVHRDTVMRLGVRIGNACQTLMDQSMRGLPCAQLELDEIWGFVGKKQRRVTEFDGADVGDVWTWVALDPESKVVPTYHVGKREIADAHTFVADVA